MSDVRIASECPCFSSIGLTKLFVKLEEICEIVVVGWGEGIVCGVERERGRVQQN